MKRQILTLITSIVLSLSFGQVLLAQDGKISIKITKDINGEKRTFEGEYNSVEEMKADPNYKDFAGDDEEANLWFSTGDDFSIHFDHLKNHGNAFFKFFDSDDEDGNSFFFHRFNDDSSSGFYNFNGWNFDGHEEISEEIQQILEKLKDQEANRSNRFSITIRKKVSISDVDDEFGKKGRVDKNTQLELEDLSFYPNPSTDGKFRIRFTTPREEKMTIKVYDLQGREVFGRYFSSFSGTYSEDVDLSGQEEGIYLLEISQGGKRLTKKVVIN